MKVIPTLILGFLLPAVMAAAAGVKSYIVSFSNETPQSVVEEAKQKLRESGAKITHEYDLIKGFAVEAPESVMNTIKVEGSEHPPMIEEDKMVSVG